MIDEKKLIEALNNDDGMDLTVTFDGYSPKDVCNAFQNFTNKMKEGFVNLINMQPRVSAGGWIRTADEQPGMFVSVLMYVPGDHPLPVVHEGYLTGDNIWVSVYGEPYTIDEVPLWMPMPEPPKVGGGA
jgi:hypothetical protein